MSGVRKSAQGKRIGAGWAFFLSLRGGVREYKTSVHFTAPFFYRTRVERRKPARAGGMFRKKQERRQCAVHQNSKTPWLCFPSVLLVRRLEGLEQSDHGSVWTRGNAESHVLKTIRLVSDE